MKKENGLVFGDNRRKMCFPVLFGIDKDAFPYKEAAWEAQSHKISQL